MRSRANRCSLTLTRSVSVLKRQFNKEQSAIQLKANIYVNSLFLEHFTSDQRRVWANTSVEQMVSRLQRVCQPAAGACESNTKGGVVRGPLPLLSLTCACVQASSVGCGLAGSPPEPSSCQCSSPGPVRREEAHREKELTRCWHQNTGSSQTGRGK